MGYGAKESTISAVEISYFIRLNNNKVDLNRSVKSHESKKRSVTSWVEHTQLIHKLESKDPASQLDKRLKPKERKEDKNSRYPSPHTTRVLCN